MYFDPWEEQWDYLVYDFLDSGHRPIPVVAVELQSIKNRSTVGWIRASSNMTKRRLDLRQDGVQKVPICSKVSWAKNGHIPLREDGA